MKKAVSTTVLTVLIVLTAFGLWRLAHPSPRTPDLPEPSLKALAAKHDLQLGNFAILNHIYEKPYSDVLTSQFDFVLADNTPNWYFTDGGLRPSSTTYNFKQMDQVMAYAKQHNMPVQAHHYLWGEEKWLPDWLKKGHYNRDQIMQLIHDHITTVGTRKFGHHL